MKRDDEDSGATSDEVGRGRGASDASAPARASAGGDAKDGEKPKLEGTIVRTPRSGVPDEKPAPPKGAPRASFAALKAPEMDLPKGGGALKGIGEKLTVNPASGSASLAIPLPASPCPRGPDIGLSLTYDTGGGQGPFGMGWSLGVPSITRRTDKKLPEYLDSQDSDVFVLAGAEDLVPLPGEDQPPAEGTIAVRRYRPRTEGSFSRIDRLTDTVAKTTSWRVVDRTNVTRTFGTSAGSRIVNPSFEGQVFTWLLDRVEDDRGNVVVYEYRAEDDTGLDPARPSTRARRKGWLRFANRYLKRVRYGNTTPGDEGTASLELVLDYGDHPTDVLPTPGDTEPWPVRADAFSSMRSGFDLRTNRLCRRVLMFHRFAALGVDPRLVRSLELTYAEDPRATTLESARIVGYDETGTAAPQPSIAFAYTTGDYNHRVQAVAETVDAPSFDDLPRKELTRKVAWTDLEGDGMPGLLIDWGHSFAYKRNRGGAEFQPARVLHSAPLGARLQGETQLMDIGGDGTMSLVRLEKPGAGYWERDTKADTFKPLVAFGTVPNVDWQSPNLKMLDLNGDGLDDILVIRPSTFEWYPSLGKDGWGPARILQRPKDEDRGPTLLGTESTGALFLADMTGDGLPDLVRVEAMRVMYWPNLGRGRFGATIVMDTSPKLALLAGTFDPGRVQLADLDNTGPADLVYQDGEHLHVYLNQAGNSFDAGHVTKTIHPYDLRQTMSFVDLYGDGTKAIVWADLQSNTTPLRMVKPYAEKPFLLNEIQNGMGLTMRLEYTTSAKLATADRRAGRPWATKVPFPVQVVSRCEHYDVIAKTRIVSTYSYRHGFYDRSEREFRGFGYVEQTDTESFDENHGQGLFPDYPVVGTETPTPPVVTKTWFHTGAWHELGSIDAAYEAEYWSVDGDAPPRRPHLFPASMTPHDRRDALRALRGSMLRQEVFGLDGTDAEGAPYLVTEASYEVLRRQAETDPITNTVPEAPRPQHPPVFQVVERERRTLHYERDATDPRIQQSLALDLDDKYGTVLRAAEVGYPRRGMGRPAEQTVVLAFVVENDVAHVDSGGDGYRLEISLRARAFDVTGLTKPVGDLFSASDFNTAFQGADLLEPHESPTSGVESRLIEQSATRYVDSDDLPNLLAFGTADARALVHETYLKAFTDDLVDQLYAVPSPGTGTFVDSTLLGNLGYLTPVDGDEGYWLRSGHSVFQEDFLLPTSFVDARGNETEVEYDTEQMFVVSMTDPLDNEVALEINYHFLAPTQVTDPNLNHTAVAFDGMGRVTKMAVLGKSASPEGDTLTDPTVAYEYTLDAFSTDGSPNSVHVLAREEHGGGPTRFQESYVYSDGSGNVAMTKQKVADGPLTPGGMAVSPRWVGSGKTVRNNKGLVIKQYEPYFSDTEEFEDEEAIVTQGVTAVVTYDPVGRITRIDLPNGSYRRAEWTAWETTTYDENDTVSEPGNKWADERDGLSTSAGEGRAWSLTVAHADTPTLQERDVWGRVFRVSETDGTDDIVTSTTYDILGQPLTITDALERVAQQYAYAMGGLAARSENIDAGSRWTITDVRGADSHRWDSRGQHFRTATDPLARPTHLYVDQGSGELLLQRSVYGESIPVVADAQDINARGQLIASYDGAGAVLVVGYDFKGNLLESNRRLVADSENTPDWIALDALTDPATIDSTAAGDLESEVFTTSATYDALNRPTSQTTPDASVTRSTYDDGGALVAVEVDVRGNTPATPIVTDITYDAKGQRQSITYGNGTETVYTYDPLTFRLAQLVTTRTSPSNTLQDLTYTYDPIGNIVEIVDAAQQTVFYDNSVASPSMTYVYDAIYRLITANGREHAGLIGDDQRDERDLPINNLPHANDMSAVRRYEETYAYDEVGNFESFAHVAVGNAGATWTRLYDYGVGKPNNRLQTNSLPGDTTAPFTAAYTYDDHGNVLSMPHLSTIDWDPGDQMQRADLGGGGEVFFTYDAAGQRVRKYRKHIGTLVEERIYLGAFELYRRRLSGTLQVERETLHVMDGVRRVAMIETKTVDTAVVGLVPTPRFRFQLGNHLETAHLEVDDSGLVISYEEMHPYGTSAYRSAASAVEVSARRYRYTGKERDDETGLDYFGARYYASWLGRWVSADPLGVQAGINLYLYCRAGPVTLLDPDGMDETPGAMLNRLSTRLWGQDAVRTGPKPTGKLTLSTANASESSGGPRARPIPQGDPFARIAQDTAAAGTVAAGAVERSLAQAVLSLDEPGGFLYEVAQGSVDPFMSTAGAPATQLEASQTPATLSNTDFAINVGLSVAGGKLLGKFGSWMFGSLDASAAAGYSATRGVNRPLSVGAAAAEGDDAADALFGQLSDNVKYRIVRGDAKGRPFGSPSNPGLPTAQELNAAVIDVPVATLQNMYSSTKHGLFPSQANAIGKLSNEELLLFRIDDPISIGHTPEGGLLTGGHHRMAEIQRRVTSGELDPDTKVGILFHD